MLAVSAKTQEASCVSVNDWLPTEIVPLRWLAVVFAEAVQLTVPLPVPLLESSVIQVAEVLAVQAQAVVTSNCPEPPVAGIVSRRGAREIVQVPADWVTVKTWPAMVMVPIRWLGVLFAATR